MSTTSAPYRILMVCTGNICRSTTAEALLRHMVADAGLSNKIVIDSAGTTDWHKGEPATPMAVALAEERGYDFTGIRSRPIKESDFEEFDLLLGMDESHITYLERHKPSGAGAEIALFLSADDAAGRPDVPDPYYGGLPEYTYSLDLIEQGCRAWIARLKERL